MTQRLAGSASAVDLPLLTSTMMKTPRNTIVVYAGVGHSINVNVAPRSTANIIVISSSFVTLIGLAWAPALRHGPLTTIHLIHATMLEAICQISVQLLDAGT